MKTQLVLQRVAWCVENPHILCQKYYENKGKYPSVHFYLLYVTHLWRPRSNVNNSMKTPRAPYIRNLFFLYFPHCILISLFYCNPFSLKKKPHLFIWLCWVLVAVRGLSSCGSRTQYLLHVDLIPPQHVRFQFPDQGLNPRFLHWKVDT